MYMQTVFGTFMIMFAFALAGLSQCAGSNTFEIESTLANLEKTEKRSRRTGKSSENDAASFEAYPNEFITYGVGFSEGLARVVVAGKSGFIDRDGTTVIMPRFTIAGSFSEGLAEVRIGKKWGYIDQAGKLAIPAEFDAADSFSDGMALVKVGEHWGYISRSGKFEIEPKFEWAESFCEGTAVVRFYDRNYVWTTHKRENGRWVANFIDKAGRSKFPKNFEGISRNYDKGMALVDRVVGYRNGGVLVESIFIDTAGRELWRYDSAYISYFSEDLIVTELTRDKETKLSTYSFLDRNGKRVTNQTYTSLLSFSEGLAVASVGGQFGYIDKTGEFVIEPTFFSADSFSDGLAAVRQDYKTGFIDQTGKWKFQRKFDWTNGFHEGRAAIANGEIVSYIDQTGKVIWKPSK